MFVIAAGPPRPREQCDHSGPVPPAEQRAGVWCLAADAVRTRGYAPRAAAPPRPSLSAGRSRRVPPPSQRAERRRVAERAVRPCGAAAVLPAPGQRAELRRLTADGVRTAPPGRPDGAHQGRRPVETFKSSRMALVGRPIGRLPVIFRRDQVSELRARGVTIAPDSTPPRSSSTRKCARPLPSPAMIVRPRAMAQHDTPRLPGEAVNAWPRATLRTTRRTAALSASRSRSAHGPRRRATAAAGNRRGCHAAAWGSTTPETAARLAADVDSRTRDNARVPAGRRSAAGCVKARARSVANWTVKPPACSRVFLLTAVNRNGALASGQQRGEWGAARTQLVRSCCELGVRAIRVHDQRRY